MIRRFVDKNCRAIVTYPLIYLLAMVLLSGVFTWLYLTLPTETSVESLIISDDPDLIFYQSFKEQFGEDEFLVVGFSAPDVFDPAILSYISEQTQRLEHFSEVEDVVSLSNVEDFRGFEDDFIVEPLLLEMPQTAQEQEDLRQRASANSLIYGHLVNSTSTDTLILIRPAKQLNDPGFDERLVSKVERLFSQTPPPFAEFSWHIAGWLVTDVNMSRFMTRDMLTFMPLTFILLVVLVGLALRNLWATVLAIVNVCVCLVWTLAFLHLFGGAMSPITSILPPLIMALAVADSIHVFNAFLKQDRRHEPLPEVMRRALVPLALPCFLTSFTTAIGFASLSVSQVPPIRHFGLAAAVGMISEFFLTMTLIPLGIYFLRHKKGLQTASMEKNSILYKPLQLFARRLPPYRRVIVCLSVVLIVVSLVFTLNIRVETNLLEYFKRDSSVRAASRFIDTQLGGVETLEISLTAQKEGALLEPEALRMVEKVEQFLKQQEIVTEVTSVNNFFREMNKAFHNEDPAWFVLPESRAMAAQYLLLYDGDDLGYLLNEERNWTRITARITEHNSSRVAHNIAAAQNFLDDLTQGTPYAARVTGKTLMSNKLISFIVSTQIQSLGLAFLLIFLLMLRIFRSWKLGVIALIPNIIPVLLNFAVMGAFGVPLNSATAIIAAVAIGIAVDDTIHFICNYQNLRQSDETVVAAVRHTLVQKGHPIVTTSLIMAGAFAVLMFGSFVPTIQFGFLCSLIMVFAVVADLVVLPAIFLTLES